MVRLAAILAFMVLGALIWWGETVGILKVVGMLGGRLGNIVRMGDEELIALNYFVIPGVMIGTIINGILGNWAANTHRQPDSAFYVVGGILMLSLPLAVICLGLAYIASFEYQG